MTLQGSVAVLTRVQDTAAAVQQFKLANPQVADVTVLAVAEGSDVAQTVAGSNANEGAFDAVVTLSEQTEPLGAELAALLPLLKAGGALQLHVGDVTEDKKNAVLMALMIGGLVDSADKQEGSPLYPQLSNAVCFSSKKQAFESAAIPLAKRTTTAQPLKKWTVLADDVSDDEQDDDIIDEDTLLDDTDEVLQAAKADCGEKVGGKKRACKNCTCG
jgi:hypothetical protein